MKTVYSFIQKQSLNLFYCVVGIDYS